MTVPTQNTSFFQLNYLDISKVSKTIYRGTLVERKRSRKDGDKKEKLAEEKQQEQRRRRRKGGRGVEKMRWRRKTM